MQSQQEEQQQYHDRSKLLRTFDVGDNVYAEDLEQGDHIGFLELLKREQVHFHT